MDKWMKTGVLAGALFLLSGCVFNINNINIPTQIQPLVENRINGSGPDKIVLMDLTGSITDQPSKGMFNPGLSPVARIKEELDRAEADPAVKAIVLRINSPGGTVTASDMIYHEILAFKKKTGKAVIASITNLGASGGYYVAMAADRILVHPTTVTGSIGVIMVSINASGLLEKIGVSGTAIKSGVHKDMGSPFRPMTDADRALFQGIIDEMYGRFIAVVAAGRPKLTEDEIRKAADGRVYTGQQALELGLVDGIGYLENAVASAKNQANLQKATLIRYDRPGSYQTNIYSAAPVTPPMVNLVNLDLGSFIEAGVPQFLYMWIPDRE